MSHFRCPVCREPLYVNDAAWQCRNGHSFDKARGGYVNLLQSQQSKAKRHGDDKRMLTARRDFLNSGAYGALRDLLCNTVAREIKKDGVLLDTGCGEGYYTAFIADTLPSLCVCGIDISKDALRMASARSSAMELAVASVFALPVANNSCDGVLSVFAPCADAEFARVLKRGGKLIRVIPTERHLFGLKAAVYNEPRLNKPEKAEIDGFTLLHRQELQSTLVLKTPDDIRCLFEMTPYYYKTGQADQQRLLARTTLETEIAFAILTYQKT